MTQGPYHLFSIGLLLVLAYLVSLAAVRIQLLPLTNHRRFWNVLLLTFFTATGALGILLAVQVNYKLEFSWVEIALQWHVDLGIGFAMVSIFHLTWHLGYYKKMKLRKRSAPSGNGWAPHLAMERGKVKWLFLLLGFISMMAQLLLLREFVRTLHGNELVIGVYLALWMILTATGSWAGSVYRVKISSTALLNMLWMLATSPLFIYLLLLLADRFLFLPGYEPGMIASIAYIAILLAFFGLVSGFLFAYLARSVKWQGPGSSFYMLDSLGSLAGGLLFCVLLVYLLDNLQVLVLLPMITILALVFLFGHPVKKRPRIILLALSLLLLLAGMLPGVRHSLERMHFRSETILMSKDTPYGNLTFTSRDGQVTGYMDRNPIMSSAEVAVTEETVHYPALQLSEPRSFLLIGGALSGNASEVNKYSPLIFDYCEADPDIYRYGRNYLPDIEGDVMQFRPMDGRRWLTGNSETSYDVIISAMGDPVTLGWNRYYTIEFYRLVREHLQEGGVFATQLKAGGNYVNDPGEAFIGMNYFTLKQVFDHVLLVPGYATYFLASDHPLSLDFPALADSHGISTTYVNGDYLDAGHLQFDSDQLMERIEQESFRINSDLWPRLFFTGLTSIESRMGGHALFISGILSMLIFLTLVLIYKPLKTGMYITGFSGAGIQIVLILVLQSCYGYAYLAAPLMITVFMGGIVVGARSWKKILRSQSVSKFTGLIWSMAILAAVLVVVLKQKPLFEHRLLGQFLLGIFNFLPGLLVGSVYGMSIGLSREERHSGMGLFYSADLTGAALGTFIPGIFMIPLIGVTNTFILFCGINVATGLYILTRWR